MRRLLPLATLLFLFFQHLSFAQWTQQNSGTTLILQDVCFPDTNNGWIVGWTYPYQGIILTTTNGGSDWITQLSISRAVVAVSFPDLVNGWAVGDSTVYKTTNGGMNWTSQSIQNIIGIADVSFANSSTGWIVGVQNGGGAIFKTTDGGTSWFPQTSGTIYTLRCVYAFDENIAITGGDFGTIRRTTNGGTTWNAQIIDTTSHLDDAFFIDADNGWISGNTGGYGKIFKTTDGGTNWILQNTGTIGSMLGIYFPDVNSGWAVGYFGRVLNTTNGGGSWDSQSITTEDLKSVSFPDINHGWAVGDNGTIFKYDVNTSSNITVTAPPAGAIWTIGSPQIVQWTSVNVTGNVNIKLSKDGGSTFPITLASNTANDETEEITVPNVPSTTCRVKVESYNDPNIYGLNPGNFTISQGSSITVISPNGGENWQINSVHNITWDWNDVSNVKIDYTTDNGGNWIQIVASTPCDGSYSWTIPNTPSTQCKVKITDVTNGSVTDESDEVFTISHGSSITVISPNGGENWQIEQTYNIEWTDNISENVKIELYKGGTFNREISSSTPSNGSFSWNIPSDVTPGTDYKVKITSINDPNIFDFSEGNFTIYLTQTITLIKPNGGEIWPISATDTIKWSSININQVKIEYSTDQGVNWTELYNVPGSSSMILWEILETPSVKCKVRVSDLNNPSIFDESENTFKILYHLYKPVGANSYERFEITKNAWKFGNNATYPNGHFKMWPEEWWGGNPPRFDYTNPPYPSGWPYWPINARSDDFPDWPILVDVFGEDVCYLNPPPGIIIYRLFAVGRWRAFVNKIREDNQQKPWGGSCLGFAASTFLAFDYLNEFKAKFPDLGNFTNLHDLEFTDEARLAINHLFHYQWDLKYDQHKVEQSDKTPYETLQELKTMLLNPGNDRFLILQVPTASWFHVVNPIRIEKDPSNQNREWIYVYDSNYPDTEQEIEINTLQYKWYYWSLSFPTSNFLEKGLFLGYDITNYLMTPSFEGRYFSDNEENDNSGTEDYLQIFITPYCNVTIQDNEGNTIGFQDSTIINMFTNAIPISMEIGRTYSPVGYYLPKNEYKIQVENNPDTINSVIVFDSLTSITYNRVGVGFNEKDEFKYHQDLKSLLVLNNDQQVKGIRLEIIYNDSIESKTVAIEHINLNQSDSLRFEKLDENFLRIVNYGLSKIYDLSATFSDTNSFTPFFHENIILSANTAHHVIPDWNYLSSQPIKIYIDLGNNGTIDDSLEVINQITSVSDWANASIPTGFQIYQNFPNPYNPITTLRYSIPIESIVNLSVYNILGEEVAVLVNEFKKKGNYEIVFHASNLPSGIYFYRLQAGSFVKTKKMVLMK